MPEIRQILEAIDELLYAISIGFSAYQLAIFMANSWRESRRIEAEMEGQLIALKSWQDRLQSLEKEGLEPIEKIVEKPMFSGEDMITMCF